ncbi:MAG: hypothetical protein ABMB14_18460 [Myxococcota bacterium]
MSAALAAPAVPIASVDGANLQRPLWSPDGAQLSFEANFHDEKRIELYIGRVGASGAEVPFERVVARTRGTSTLTAGFRTSSSGQVVHELAWAPRGIDAYVFAASNDQFDYDLFISEGAAVAASDKADGGARWSPDGAFIAFTSARTGEGDLYLVDTRRIEAAPKQLTAQRDSSELYVDWSADGHSLVYVAHSDAGDNLWLLPALNPSWEGRSQPTGAGLGAAPSRLTTWSGNQIRPRFAPFGTRIAFYANHDDPERFDLYVVDVGGAPRLLARHVYPDADGPAWTTDGRHIVYVSDDDAAADPIRAVRVDDPTHAVTLDLGTVGNGDLDLGVRDGAPWIAVVAQGGQTDTRRDFKRLFAAPLPAMP